MITNYWFGLQSKPSSLPHKLTVHNFISYHNSRDSKNGKKNNTITRFSFQ